jgi:CheY-like chemotaxis protein/HPt (histidine-containing phosphotransfer) domain-containing protein
VALGILENLGLRADAVANGAEAVQALGALPYDLVLMDLQMPEMDGFEAARLIRDPASQVRNHAIPIVALTARAMQRDRERCLAAGMNAYLSKPVSPQALLQVLEQCLGTGDGGAVRAAEAPAPSAESGREAVAFDRADLESRLQGNHAPLTRVVETFLADVPRQIQTLNELLEKGDAPASERHAHSIEGAAANIGAGRMRRVALEMEKAAGAGDLGAVKRRMAELQSEFERVRDAMAAGNREAPRHQEP